MKRIYSIHRPQVDAKSYVNWITKRTQKLSVSSRGLIAFTSSFCLNQRHPNSASYHVYVADINTPYQPYLVAEADCEYSIIEWDPTGTKLLTCDVRGCITIYSSNDYLISDWKPYYRKIFTSEHFIASSWYHLGLTSCINVTNQNLKSPSNHLEYAEKIQQAKYGASLRLFGGKSAEGCILVSRSGLVCCLSLMTDKSVDVVVECLGPTRARIEVADICHCKDGSFIVGSSAGSINSTISFHQINLTSKNITLDEVYMANGVDGNRVSVSITPYHSFHLNVMSQMFNDSDNATTFDRVAHIKFESKDSPDDVLIEVSGQNLSLIELWELEARKKNTANSAIPDMMNAEDVKPNNLLAGPEENGANHDDLPKGWAFKGNYITEKNLATIQVPKFKIFGQNRQLNIIILTYKDSTVRCMRKEDLQLIEGPLDLSATLDPKPEIDKPVYKVFPNLNASNRSSKEKKVKHIHITDVQVSCNQACLVAIDSMSQIHVAKLPNLISCQDARDEETYAQYLLEFCLVTGNDWWDVMMSIPRDSIEAVCDKFHDAYERQPKHVQKIYYNRQLMIRASLYRCLNTVQGLCKSSDCHTMIMLNSIASTLKSTLRSQDQESPAVFLSDFLKTQGSQPNFFSYNNVITKIKESEFFVETNLIQCLQPLNQWVTDLAIFLAVSLPQRSAKMAPLLPGEGVAKSKEALELLRELLVIIKIWGPQNETSMPNLYKLNDQVDILGSLFRILSICYANIGKDMEEPFVAECTMLANQISNSMVVPQFLLSLDAIGVASPLFFSLQSIPNQQVNDGKYLSLQYFKHPTPPKLAKLLPFEGSINMTAGRKMDIVRNISLGAHPVANIRQCTRCKAVSLIRPAFQTTRAWEQRWIRICVCGGSWGQSDTTYVDKAGYLAKLHHATTISAHNHSTHQLVW